MKHAGHLSHNTLSAQGSYSCFLCKTQKCVTVYHRRTFCFSLMIISLAHITTHNCTEYTCLQMFAAKASSSEKLDLGSLYFQLPLPPPETFLCSSCLLPRSGGVLPQRQLCCSPGPGVRRHSRTHCLDLCFLDTRPISMASLS